MLARADTAKPWKPKKLKLASNDWELPAVDINYKPSKVLKFEPTPLPKDNHRPGMLPRRCGGKTWWSECIFVVMLVEKVAVSAAS